MSSSVLRINEIGVRDTDNQTGDNYLRLASTARVRKIGPDYPFAELWTAALVNIKTPYLFESLTANDTDSEQMFAYDISSSDYAPLLFGLCSGSDTEYESATNHQFGWSFGSTSAVQKKSAAGTPYIDWTWFPYKVENGVRTATSGNTIVLSVDPTKRSLLFQRFIVGSPNWSIQACTPRVASLAQDVDYTEADVKAILEYPDWATLSPDLASVFGLTATSLRTMAIDTATYGDFDHVMYGWPHWGSELNLSCIAGIKKS